MSRFEGLYRLDEYGMLVPARWETGKIPPVVKIGLTPGMENITTLDDFLAFVHSVDEIYINPPAKHNERDFKLQSAVEFEYMTSNDDGLFCQALIVKFDFKADTTFLGKMGELPPIVLRFEVPTTPGVSGDFPRTSAIRATIRTLFHGFPRSKSGQRFMPRDEDLQLGVLGTFPMLLMSGLFQSKAFSQDRKVIIDPATFGFSYNMKRSQMFKVLRQGRPIRNEDLDPDMGYFMTSKQRQRKEMRERNAVIRREAILKAEEERRQLRRRQEAKRKAQENVEVEDDDGDSTDVEESSGMSSDFGSSSGYENKKARHYEAILSQALIDAGGDLEKAFAALTL